MTVKLLFDEKSESSLEVTRFCSCLSPTSERHLRVRQILLIFLCPPPPNPIQAHQIFGYPLELEQVFFSKGPKPLHLTKQTPPYHIVGGFVVAFPIGSPKRTEQWNTGDV